jgi:hypothetical protein
MYQIKAKKRKENLINEFLDKRKYFAQDINELKKEADNIQQEIPYINYESIEVNGPKVNK